MSTDLVPAAPPARVVIVGAGHAGGATAAQLRQFGYAGEILLVGEEPLPPYQRPPLSKAWLKGKADGEALQLRPEAFYAEHGIDLRLGAEVTALDRAAKQVRLRDGRTLAYDVLVLATGSRAALPPVPGADGPAVLRLRTVADADRLKAGFTRGGRLLVVGAGYVGLEVAASARALGCEVMVFEREATILARVASAPIADFFRRVHGAYGVRIETSAQVRAIAADARAVELSDGRAVAGDMVLVGVGASVCDGLAASAGLRCDGGVVVDDACRTADPFVFAVGDCTRRPLPLYEACGRVESVPNALEQAKQAAAAICGAPPPAPEVPWFWSDQYEHKLQIAGLPIGVDRLVLRGDPARDRFSVFHLAGPVVHAVEAVNAPADFMAGRLMIGRKTAVEPDRLAEPSVPIKSLMG